MEKELKAFTFHLAGTDSGEANPPSPPTQNQRAGSLMTVAFCPVNSLKQLPTYVSCPVAHETLEGLWEFEDCTSLHSQET